MYKIEDFAMMEAMRYYNNEKDCPKRQDMLDNKNGAYIATEKHDGDWAMLIHYKSGENLVRSRSISKVTGVYGDYTAKVPHIVESMDRWPDNTVVLAELCWDKYGTNANTVGTILRCLPPKAIERQKEQKLCALMFDILMVSGCDFTHIGYGERILMLQEFSEECGSEYVRNTAIFRNDFQEAADAIIAAGGEGCVIQRKDYIYEPGARTAWKTLKLKQQLPEMELKVIGVLEPNKKYDGDCINSWKYWIEEEDANGIEYVIPVTKPYFMGWKNGITVELPDGTTTDIASGLTDADREWLATDEAIKMIKNNELYAVIKAMSFNDKGKLRHGSLVRLRNDM